MQRFHIGFEIKMNRKRVDSECHDQEDNRLAPMTKKIKSPLPTMTKSSNEPNDSMKFTIISNLSAQSSGGICHSRKRRPRTAQEMYETNSSTNTSIPFATTSTNGQLRKRSDLSCVVCCGLAHGYNFDAISCESCKAFFRRNALFNVDRLKCRRDGTCDITLETRRRCKSCRLKKCFAVGMRKEWILTEEEKVNKKRRIEENRRIRLYTTSTMKDPFNSTEKSDLDLQTVVLDKNQVLSIKSISSMANNDVISNVARAFNDGFKLDPTSYGWSYPLAKKITALCQILNTKNTTALRLISFYKRLTEFDALNDFDKVNLIKNNLPYIFMFHGSLGYDPINDKYHEGTPPNHTILHGTDIREAHGNDIHFRCTSIMRSLQSIVQMDPRLIPLTLVIMLFSRGLSTPMNAPESSLNNPQKVFQAQNFYLEHLWIFMEKYYGSTRAILTLSTLIGQCLHIQLLLRDIQQDIHEKIDPYQVPPIMRALIHLS